VSTQQTTWSTPFASDVRRPRLLIADDDPVVRSVVSTQVANNFEIVGAAADTSEAIDLAREHHPDAALIDIDMPGGGGLEAVRQISVVSPATCMVILSADEIRDHVIELLIAGAVSYVRKGASGPQIVKTLTDSMKAHADAAA
jgi:two-component system nitrate/nitrite response regulator NarL